jgi:hypothetical protein
MFHITRLCEGSRYLLLRICPGLAMACRLAQIRMIRASA